MELTRNQIAYKTEGNVLFISKPMGQTAIKMNQKISDTENTSIGH